ncbi:MAG: ribosome silencing factor [Streptococcaceae bacterium]|nr:ribosome silencing factor [Streptococcaceae bacterium]
MQVKELLELVVKAADDKKALDIVALDVSQLSGISDYFVIMEGMNSRQLGAIVDAIDEAAHNAGIEIGGKVEGQPDSGWVLMDMGDVIVSVFDHETRLRFNLEKLWNDAPMVDLTAWVSE